MLDIEAILSNYPNVGLSILVQQHLKEEHNCRLISDIIYNKYGFWEPLLRSEIDPVDLALEGLKTASLNWLIQQPLDWHLRYEEHYMNLFGELQGEARQTRCLDRLKQCLGHTGLGLLPEVYYGYTPGADRKAYIDRTLLYLIYLKRTVTANSKVKHVLPWTPQEVLAGCAYDDFVPALYKYSLADPQDAMHLLAEMLNSAVDPPEPFELAYARVYLLQAFKALEQDLSDKTLDRLRAVNEFLRDWARKLVDTVLQHPALEQLNERLKAVSGQAINERMEKPKATIDNIDHFITDN